MLDPSAIVELAARCAPSIAPETMLAITQVESGRNPLAIGVNRWRGPRPRPTSPQAAAEAARALTAAGRDIDLGLAQINVRNLGWLGLTFETAFDPCRNLAASAQVLRAGYERGRRQHGPGQAALQVALSVYNTGDVRRGFTNGYVARVLAQAAGSPAVAASPPQARLVATPSPLADVQVAASDLGATPLQPAPPPAWDVFGRAAVVRARFVLTPSGATP